MVLCLKGVCGGVGWRGASENPTFGNKTRVQASVPGSISEDSAV